MATYRVFNDLLMDYVDEGVIMEEWKRRDYFIQNSVWKNDWKGGAIPRVYEAASPSSVEVGALPADTDIADAMYAKGEISSTTMLELYASLQFHHRDLIEHDGKVLEDSFLKILPGKLDGMVDYMKQCASGAWLQGKWIDKLTDNATGSDGVIKVGRPEMLKLGQKIVVDDDDSNAITAYIKSININTKEVVLATTRGGSTLVDFSGANMTTAQNAKIYIPGAISSGVVSWKDMLLPAANGGASTIAGKTKTDYPILQSISIDGTSWAAATILDNLFDAQLTVAQLGKGNPSEVRMSFKNYAFVIKALEDKSGTYKYTEAKANVYGYQEITITGVKGTLKCVAIREHGDDWMQIVNAKPTKIYSNGGFRVIVGPDGNRYTKIRATTGHKYIVDIMCHAVLDFNDVPSHCGIVHSVNLT